MHLGTKAHIKVATLGHLKGHFKNLKNVHFCRTLSRSSTVLDALYTKVAVLNVDERTLRSKSLKIPTEKLTFRKVAGF